MTIVNMLHVIISDVIIVTMLMIIMRCGTGVLDILIHVTIVTAMTSANMVHANH